MKDFFNDLDTDIQAEAAPQIGTIFAEIKADPLGNTNVGAEEMTDMPFPRNDHACGYWSPTIIKSD